jgi:PAS domain S-box-containing protein
MAAETSGVRGDAQDFDIAGWFFDNGLDVFIVLRGRVLERVNPAWTILTGWSPEESLGRHMDEFGHPDNLAAINAATRQMETYGVAETDIRVRTKDGRWLCTSCRIRLNGDGLIMAVMRDVTAQRERELEENQARHATELLREVAGVRIWRFDPDHNLYLVDEHLNRTSLSGGFGHRVMKTEEMASEVHPEDAGKVWADFAQVLKTGETRIVEYRHRLAEDLWTRLKATMRGVRKTASGKWEVMGLTHDVTEIANARDVAIQGEQAARDAAESKSQFLANMSHEIRTPLNGVLGVLHLLKTESLTDQGRALLAEAVNCGSMLAELLNDVLDFSKIEAGRLELENQPVDVAAVIDGVVAILRPQVEAKGLSFTTDVEPGVGWVSTDPVRLRQVLFNLIGNAVKFTAEGAVSIHLKSTGEGEARRLRFEIRDSGIGISPEAQASLFARFHQADGSTTRRFGGTGLGLAITKRLVEMMGGEVGVESVEGEGSTFWIEMLAPEIAASPAVETDEAPCLEGLTVLVVEDNPTNRLIATKMLENLGAAVETAENGALGVKAVKRTDFDLVFMDVQMPVMDGLDATLAIRALPAPASQVPIIAMTANAMAHQVREYLRVGMNGAVSKPLSPAAIVREIARLAGESGPDAAAAAA